MSAATLWFFAQQGTSVGPVSEDQMESLVQSGVITAATLVWPGDGDWIPAASSTLGRFIASRPGIRARPAVVAGTAPVTTLKPSARDSLTFRRYFAWKIDLVVAFGILAGADWLLGNEVYRRTLAVWLLLAIAYRPVLGAMTGRTLGRLMTGTMVVDANGNIPGLSQVLRRKYLIRHRDRARLIART